MFDSEDEKTAAKDIEYYFESEDGRSYRIPPAIRRGLDGYAEHGQAGGFIMAAVKNNFAEAVGRADPDTLAHLRDINWYIQNELPGTCHGSPEIVKDWAEKRRREREESDNG